MTTDTPKKATQTIYIEEMSAQESRKLSIENLQFGFDVYKRLLEAELLSKLKAQVQALPEEMVFETPTCMKEGYVSRKEVLAIIEGEV